MAYLALFWLTRWGRSQVHTQATNVALMAVALAHRTIRYPRKAKVMLQFLGV